MKIKLTLVLFFSLIGFVNFSYGQCFTGQTTKTFPYTGAIEQFTVPNGVTAITMIVTGADGGNDGTNNGGAGGTATATFPVTEGEVLDIVVGITGSSSSSITLGAGGGGGSGVRRASDNSILIIGAGAGGAGGGNGNAIGGGGNAIIFIQNLLGINNVTGNSFGDMGLTCFGCIPGGFGANSGGAGGRFDIRMAGGGGGGVRGPAGSPDGPDGGGGGSSYINSSGSLPSFVNGIDGAGTGSNGSVTFCFTQPKVIPTMSQWGLIIFGLLTMNLGVVFLRRKEALLT